MSSPTTDATAPTGSATPGGSAVARPLDLVEIDLSIGGMTCASCAARVEKKLNRMDGVLASVNYATETAHVRYPAQLDPAELVATVERTGYSAALPPPPVVTARIDEIGDRVEVEAPADGGPQDATAPTGSATPGGSATPSGSAVVRPRDLVEIDLSIGGMTCASCAARVEKKLNRMDGVLASVNYATETAHV
ncbi:MAG TPA: cation transporter, partial [Kineosporiaceae bacterium]|nr:cation transporter [Kineosporiaceae bacterium]